MGDDWQIQIASIAFGNLYDELIHYKSEDFCAH